MSKKGELQVDTYKEYKELLSKTYDKAVDCLLQKYGPAQDDYFREKSYQRFMAGEIKNITKGKFSRTDEGLYCHHIDEKNYLNISDQSFVKTNKISFDYQRKDRLVYCNLIEHTILHVLISKETSSEFGYLGYEVFLKPIIEEWYIEKKIPYPQWMKTCYDKSFLTPEESVHILKEMQKTLGMSYFSTPYEFHEKKRRTIEEVKATKRKWEEEDKKRTIEAKEEEIRMIKKKTEEFYQTYPKFKELNISFDTPRQKVIAMLFDCKYSDIYQSKKEFDLVMKPIIKDKLLKELYTALESS
ncbi:hypothetical protein [Oceanobacillus sp. J11TS1]|uniref:hypothetical protein n=1 Tax=Oceanobacillus sp. J11TS1 TaxID=2807191 RepID=UPI001FD18F00|nr:hypothetical protein [Oceanobacillus sp. J11TS1]